MRLEYVVGLVISALITGLVFGLALAFNYWVGYLATALGVVTMIAYVAVWKHNSSLSK